MPKMDPNDSSYSSRKFLLTLIGLILISIFTAGAAKNPSLEGILPTFIGGILGTLSLYFGANIGAKWTIGKINKDSNEEDGRE